MQRKKRKDLTVEFKRAAVALMMPGVKISALARELGVNRSGSMTGAMRRKRATSSCGGLGGRNARFCRRRRPTIWPAPRSV
jgi:transposase-like protein